MKTQTLLLNDITHLIQTYKFNRGKYEASADAFVSLLATKGGYKLVVKKRA